MKRVSILHRKSRYFYAENMGLVYIIDLDIFVYYFNCLLSYHTHRWKIISIKINIMCIYIRYDLGLGLNEKF